MSKYSKWYPQQPVRKHSTIVDTGGKLSMLAHKMKKIEEFAFDTETNTLAVHGQNDAFKLVGISISWGAYNNYYIPLGHVREEDWDRQLPLNVVVRYLKPVFERTDIRIIGQNLKFDMHVMARVDIQIKTDDLYDIMIASWLCDENTPNGLKENSALKLGIQQEHFAEVTKTVPNSVKKQFGLKASSKATFDMVLIDDGAPYALDDAFFTWCLYVGSLEELAHEGMDKIYNKTYRRFLRTLFEMEERGATVDTDRLKQMDIDIEKDKEELLYKIYELAGCEFNVNSNNQLQELLFGYQKPIPDPREDARKWRSFTEKEQSKKLKDYEKKLFEQEHSKLLKYSFKFKPVSKTSSGAPQCNADALIKLSKQEFKVKAKRDGVEMCKYLLQYKKLEKLSSAFISGLSEQLYSDGKAHPSFNIIGTDSGRISCIEENTLITCVGGQKPIKDIKCGDLVYCYDDSGNLKISKVTGVFDNGMRDCVRLDWKSTGKHDKGFLICTPDHRILTRSGKWEEAKDLLIRGKYGAKVCHLRRVTENRERPVLYSAGRHMEQEQLVIKREYFGCTDSNICIHHRDGNSSNNSIDNLELMPKSEHTSYHSKQLVAEGRIRTDQLRVPHKVLSGAEHPMYRSFTAEELEAMVHKAKGRIREIPMDFNTFKKKCMEVDFDYKAVASKYQKQYSEPTEQEFSEAYQQYNGVAYKIREALNIGRVKYNKLIKKYDVCANHEIVGITPVGIKHVYDLEVEDYHNFIANEICVHNCSSPNLQQLPKADDEDKYQIRSLFIGSEYVADENGDWVSDDLSVVDDDPSYEIKRKKIVAGDYNNLEMRVLAHYCIQRNMPIALADGGSREIGTLVQKCEPVYVKSYNFETGKIQNMPVSDFWKNGKSALYDKPQYRGEFKDWLRITNDGDDSRLIVTHNHSIFTTEGKKLARDLRVGDTIYYNAPCIENDLKDLVIGMSLGDSNFVKGSDNLTFYHSQKQYEYLMWKYRLLKDFVTGTIQEEGKMHKAIIGANPFIRKLKRYFTNSDGKKHKQINAELLSSLNLKSLAVWYLDDGCLGHDSRCSDTKGYSVTIARENLSDEAFKVLKDKLNEYDLNFNKIKGGISCSGDSALDFLNAIAPYTPKCMAYKFPKFLQDNLETYQWNTKHKDVTEVKIISIEQVKEGDKLFSKSLTQSGYDLEVPVNHNYFANNILVSNSKDHNLLEMFETGSDTHSSTAVNMFELDCDIADVKKKYPHLRQAAKVINFLDQSLVA